MPKIALIEYVKLLKIALIEYLPLSNLQFLNHLLHSTDLFQCYCWQKYTTISNTDLYLSYFDLSYIFPGHNDSVEWGPTVEGFFANTSWGAVMDNENLKLQSASTDNQLPPNYENFLFGYI